MPEEKGHTLSISRYMHTADGRKLYYMEQGTGSLTVVFEAGMGMSRSAWGLVQPLVADFARAVVYDRAGSGRSDPDAAPRTLVRMAEDLLALLRHLESEVFILVGHSWGGPIVRMAASLAPAQVRGLVLVDPTDEHCELYFRRLSKIHFALMNIVTPVLARIGMYRRLGSGAGRVLPEDVYQDHCREDFTIQAARTMAAEGKIFLEELKTLRDRPLQLAGIEATIISGTHVTRMERGIRPLLIAAHQKSAAINGWHWVAAENSGHMVIYQQPQLIVDEIRRMIVSGE
ncbi:Sigma factor SigB regulation protein RsbQ [Anoxybacillus sp. P3H1B]|uniref:alpha/beta hydrolase n=1 Tax=Anoxybacillus sp. P3H1B TaxID=1769293 RepID=UPI00079B2C3A|nr:alpha/beta hydrolase [Anoxybacillus sp. P3H1B]KXG09103.1 Sigma factor SigB regulation protein RsbQ [Anoxybacillus sp. P3H1B]